jgi:hypothetical protein
VLDVSSEVAVPCKKQDIQSEFKVPSYLLRNLYQPVLEDLCGSSSAT